MAYSRKARVVVSASLLVSAAGGPVSVLAQAPAPEAPASHAQPPVNDAGAAPKSDSDKGAQPSSQPATPTANAQTQPPVQQTPANQPAPAQPPVQPPAPQPAPAPAATQPAAEPPKAQQPEPAKPTQIGFNFKDTPFDMVLDFFSREAGLPIIREAPVPAAAMTFISGQTYSFEDALSILNLNLAMHGVQLRKQDQYLYLATLQDSAKKPSVVAKGDVPAGARPEQILTLTIPLDSASAALVAEQIKPLIGPFGGVTAVPQQNLVIITETAAQCRRIREIVQAIDVQQVDQQFKLFPLKNAQADAVVGALKGLMGERVRQTFVDKDGKQTTVQDVSVAGLNIQADARTNSIVAVGTQTRLRVCQELIALLDVPDGGGGESELMTFTLRTISPDDAAAKLSSLFASVPAARKPTILPLKDSGKLTVVAPRTLLAQATALISEIDPGGGAIDPPAQESRATVLKLQHVTPAQVEQIAPRLLTPRQLGVVKFAAAPDGKSLIVTGPSSDVDAFSKLVAGLDVPPQSDKEVRLTKIAVGDPAAVLQKAQSLYAATGKSDKDPVVATLDGATRTVTLIGSRTALTQFDQLLQQSQTVMPTDTQARTFNLAKSKPSTMVAKLQRLARPLLTPDDGSPYREPTFEPVDELDRLVVRAAPSQFAVIEELIKRLDGDESAGRELRVVRVAGVDPRGVLDRAKKLYADRTAGMPESEAGPISAEIDEASGSVLISGRAAGMRLFQDAMSQAQQLLPPSRSTRVVEVLNVQVKDIVGPLEELLKTSVPVDPSRRPPDPTIQPIERTNSLVVTAEEAQHSLISDYVRRLDRLDRSNLPPLKLLQIRTADSQAIAAMLSQQYASRPQAERAAKPVDIRSDAATNTLIVSAHEELFGEIQKFVDELNKDRKDGPVRITQLFPLKVAKAQDVAAAMDKLYPQPPMPVDRLNRPMPWAQQPKEVTVSADPSSNSLIIDAPAERQDSLKALAQQLDRVELPPVSQLRTYRIIGNNLDAIATTLQALSRQGNLSGPAQPGKPPVQVVIEKEPKSQTLIIAGDEVTFERVDSVLKDLQAVPIEKGLRVIPISNAKAADVRTRALEIYNAQIKQIQGANPAEVTVDETTNSLMVVADGEGMARFMKVIEELQRQAGPAREIRMIELRHAKAAEVISFLTELLKGSKSLQIRGGPDPVIEPIETTNSLLVAAQPVQFAIIESLVKSLDNSRTAERPPLRILKLHTTDAANIAQVLQQSYDKRPVEQKNKAPVEIQADPATNTLLISAHTEVLPEIEALVNQLNEQQGKDEEGREIRIFPLKIARAEELARTIDQMYPEPPMPLDPRTRQPRPDLQRPREIIVRADRATNSLIVDAPARRLVGFEQIVRSLDQAKLAENVELRTYRVTRAELGSVATTLKSLAASGAIYGTSAPSTGLATPVTIDTEPATRTLIVSGPTPIFTQVESVLKRLDGPPDAPATGLKMYPLKHARADRLSALLEKVLTTRLREQQTADGKPVADIKNLLEVSADTASNTLIISAPEAVQKIAEELIRTLDSESAEAGKNVLRVLPLTFAEAAQLAQVLNQTTPTMELPTGGKVSVVAAPGANALLLSGAEADLNKVEELAKGLDVKPTDAGTPKVETFVVKNSDASTLAQVVQRLLSDQQETDPKMLQLKLQYSRTNRPDLFKPPTVRVEVDTKTNALIVSAPAATLELAKTLIERLDQPATESDRLAATFTPAKGDPAALAASTLRIVNATIPQGRKPLELVPEPRTGSIVALGSREQVAAALKELAALDDRTVAMPEVQLEILNLKNAEASSVGPTVQSMLSDRSRWPEALRQAERAGLGVPQPAVNADVKNNRLLVSVPTVLAPIARELVAALDQPASSASVDVRVFNLSKGEAASVAAALKTGLEAGVKPGEPKPTVTAEPSSNAVVVSGSAASIAKAAELIKPLDEAVEPAGVGVRTIFLKNARAESIAPVLEGVLTRESAIDKLPDWMKVQALSRPGFKDLPRPKVSAEKRLNAVVVSGPVAVLEIAEQVVSELDIDPSKVGGAQRRAVRIITVQNADATELSANITSVFADDAAQEQPPTIRVDKASNSLIVRATPTQMETITELTGKLDSATLSTSRQMRMVPIDRSRVDAALMARTLKRLIEQQGSVKVEVISTDELLKKNENPDGDDKNPPPAAPARKNSRLDSPASSPTPVTQVFSGGSFSRSGLWAVAAIASLQPPAAPAKPEQDDSILTIAVDPASNSLLIVGSPRMTDRLAALAAELEKQMPSEPVGVRVVTLPETADARQLAQLVSQTVMQIGRSNASNPGGFSGPVSVSADPAGSALIVLANETDFETVGRLVASISQLNSATKVSIKIYPLSSINAARAQTAIQDLLSAQPRGSQAQRLRQLDVSMTDPDGAKVSGRIDPGQVRITADPAGASIIVAAPEAAIPLIDRFVALIDQSPVTDRLSIRRYALTNARATELSRTLQTLMDAQRQGPNAAELPQARFIADERTNSLLVTASDPQHKEVTRLLATADESLDEKGFELAIIPLQQASPATVQKIVEAVLIGRDAGKKEKVRLSTDEGSNLFVVRAAKEDVEQVRQIVKQVDTSETSGLPVRPVKLERADAQTVATALQKFFTDRATASSRPGARVQNRVAVVGDRRSGTLVVAASDDDFEQVKALATTFDTPAASQDQQFKIVTFKNARVMDIEPTIRNIADQMQWERVTGARRPAEDRDDRVFMEPNERTNSLVLMGTAESLATIEKVIAALDAPGFEKSERVVKAVQVQNADPATIKTVVERALATPGWRAWRGADPESVNVEVDRRRRAVLVVGRAERVEQALAYIKELDTGGAGERQITSIGLRHAKAQRAAQSLKQFFDERARAQGLQNDSVSLIGSADGNVLIVSADGQDLKTIQDLVAQIDQPDLDKDRRFEIYYLKNNTVQEAAQTLRSIFARAGQPGDEQVVVTPQPSTNSLIVAAPNAVFEQVDALLKQLDQPPTAENSNMITYSLNSARATEVAQALKGALPQNLKVNITAVGRTNSLLLTGSDEAIKIVLEQIKKIDAEPAKSLMAFRRVKLDNAMADDAYFTVSQMLRSRPRGEAGAPQATVDYSRQDNTLSISAPQDQIEEIVSMIKALDVPADNPRKTEFVKLQFADAAQTAKALEVFYGRFAPEAATPGARSVTVFPDPSSNSLIVSATDAEWDGIRALLTKLDTKDYDTSRQLAVIRLLHADATSVARALNEGFRAPLDDRARRDQLSRLRQGDDRNRADFFVEPTILVDAEGRPTVSAEQLTNSLIIFAGRRDLERLQSLVAQLDQPGFANMPEPRVIPLVGTAKPSALAQSIREMFALSPTGQRQIGPRAVIVMGDDVSGALIVRADDAQFAQIKALAETLQQKGELTRLTPEVIRLKNVPAARLRQTLLATFTPLAQQMGETFAVEIDRGSNSLVVMCSPRMKTELERVVTELDTPILAGPGAEGATQLGQSVFIVDITNNAPDDIKKALDDMGLSKPQPADRPGVVTEPITVTTMATRRALAILASPGDSKAVIELVKALDAEPANAEQKVAVVPLKKAAVQSLVTTLTAMLKPDPQQSGTGPAAALAEHVRRLNVAGYTLDKQELKLDLSVPIRLIPDIEANSLIIASTASNVAALTEVVKSLDTLPIGDAVIVRMFPLQNASATRIKGVIEELFKQGEELRRLPGTRRQGLPTTATGQALAGEIVVSVDERTNLLVVAGREEAVAFVEVLIKDLDSDETSKWVEPAIVQLKFADAVSLAAKLRTVLVQGLGTNPEAIGLQRQFGRLRMSQQGKDPSKPGNGAVEADLFAPLTGLVITPEEQTNSLIVVGSPANLAIVRELVKTLDIEKAAASNVVQIYPLKFAAADRIAAVVQDIFRQREQTGALRPEDRLIVAADARTNALIVTTSPRSFAILESLLKTLDGEQANPAVGLHVIAVQDADAREIAPRIERLMLERINATVRSGAVRNPADAFSIEAEPINNLLIVAASDENFRIVQEVLGALTTDAKRLAAAGRSEIIQLTRLPASEVIASLRQLYIDKENKKRGEGAVSVVPVERLNALLVGGNDEDIAQLRALVTQIESTEIQAVRKVDRIELKSANALEVVRLLENVLGGRPVSGQTQGLGTRQATKIQFFRQTVAGEIKDKVGAALTEADIDGVIRDQVNLTPDLRSNSVVVTAPPQICALVREIVEDLDSTAAGARKIEVFHLKNADAKQMADALRDTFNLRQQGSAYVLVPSDPGEPAKEGDSPDAGLGSARVTAVPDERQQLSIAIDARTNALIVSGTEQYLSLVRKFVEELDSIEAQERERTVYHLRNAKAKDVESTMQRYFSGDAQLRRATLGPELSGSLVRQLEQEVTVIGDDKSNKLVISSSPRFTNTVLKIVEELDSAPPQVMIQVLLAEVTIDNDNSWGVDLTVGPFNGPGLTYSTKAAGTGVTTALGVPNLSVSSADFSLLIRALEAQGKLEVLSNPQLLVSNNQPGKIQVGEDVALAQGVERTPQGGTFSSIKRQDVGIILNVTPSINADGFVRMEIKPEISQVSTKTDQISEDFVAPRIQKRTLDTIVSVKDGQSVVIGGLLQTTEEKRVTKVPFLGDIPVIGWPFRSEQARSVKTELLVVLTPRIVPGAPLPGYADAASDRVRAITEQSIERLNDPQRVRDYLRRLEHDPVPAAPTEPRTPAPEAPSTQPLPQTPSATTAMRPASPPSTGG